uniref:T9SS type A sorting domain-containing protein n=1 Tax=Ignavibacterium album TaxID=591197 RepID=A0A832LN34_9BACT
MSGFISQGPWCVAIGGAGTIFVGDATGYVLRSTNNGTNWTGSEVASGAGVRFLRQVGLKWFAATSNGIYISSNFGVSWSLGGLQGHNVNFIAIKSSADTLTLFASTNDAGVFFTTDNGNNWLPSNNGLPTLNITGLRSTGTYLYAGTNGDGLWRIRINDLITNVDEETNTEVPSEFYLSQNYPNPFNPSTKIKFTIPSAPLSLGEGLGVRLKVYDVLGNEVATLVDEYKSAGNYEIVFNVAQSASADRPELASGIYFYRLSSGNYSITKKMVLIR